MVSFWPFKGDDTSAASFEKVLSKLSVQINKASAQNDGFRQKQRRYKVLWTLYSSFAYILVAAILTLVTGYQRWAAMEYSAVAGGPVLIFTVRTALDAYYNYRISKSQAHLNDLYKQREKAISRLKSATKYDSTQQLLDKYSGTPRQRQPSPKPPGKRKAEGPQSRQVSGQMQRTGFAPPPTANIQKAQPAPPLPRDMPNPAPRTNASLSPETRQPLGEPSEEFAPNAFSVPPRPPPVRQQSTQYAEGGAKWIDRILDVILGDDETQAKNRIALICQECKLVNGQAPPGARTLEDVGKWRCSGCHAWNGVESEEKKLLKHISGEPMSPVSPVHAPVSAADEAAHGMVSGDESGEYEQVEDEEDISEEDAVAEPQQDASPEDPSPAGSTRSKARQRKKA